MKILTEMYLWTKKSPLNFGSHLLQDLDQNRFGGGPSALLHKRVGPV